MEVVKEQIIKFLRWSQKYTKTDMLYVARGGFWIIIERVALAFVSLATLAAFANWLPVETYGTYQFVLSLTSLAAIASLPGMGAALTRSVAQGYEGSLLVAFRTKLFWSILGSIALLGAAGWYFIKGNFLLAGAFLITAILSPLRLSSLVFTNFWQGKKRFDIQALYQIVSDLGIALTVITTLFLTDNLWIILIAFLGSTAIFYGTALILTSKKTKNNFNDSDMVSFGKNLTVMNAIRTAAEYLDKIIAWKFLGPVQVAVYSFSILPIQKLTGFGFIQRLALPRLSEGGGNREEQKRSVFRKFLFLLTLTIPIAVLLAFIAPPIYRLLFPQYVESTVYFQTLTIIVALMPFSLLNTTFLAKMKTRVLYIINTLTPLVKIVLFLVLAPLFGIWGIVWTILGAEILRDLMILYYFQRI